MYAIYTYSIYHMHATRSVLTSTFKLFLVTYLYSPVLIHIFDRVVFGDLPSGPEKMVYPFVRSSSSQITGVSPSGCYSVIPTRLQLILILM